MVHGELVWWELLAAVVAGAFVELVFPPGCAFEYAGFVAFFANAFGGIGVGADFEVGFGGHNLLGLHQVEWVGTIDEHCLDRDPVPQNGSRWLG